MTTPRARWTEGPEGRLTNRKGWTLTRGAGTKGWRLCAPNGEYIITQVETSTGGVALILEWADQYIKYLEKSS